MKYIVEVKYTNPAHEHVSLRRRVDTINRVVEARNEDEAINRVANQQRALGFLIREVKVINEQQRTATFPIGGGVVNLPKNLPSEKPAKGVSALDKDGNLVGHYPDLATAKKLKPGHTYQTSKGVAKEEVEQTDEAVRVTMKGKELPPKSKRRVAGGEPTKSDRLRDDAARAAKEKRGLGGINAPLGLKSVKYHSTNYVGAKKTNEEVEQTDEAIRGYIQSEPGNQDGTAIRRPANQAERDQLAKNLIANRKYNVGKKIGRKSGSVRSNAAGMTPSQKISTALHSPDASKKMGPKKFPYMPKNAKITPFLSKEEVEQTDEALLPKQQAVADKLKASELAANKEKAGYKFGKSLRAAKVAAKMQKEETEVQYIEEKLTVADPVSAWIKDFVASDNPKFEGKSKKERIQMALGAYYAAQRDAQQETNEEAGEKYNEKEVKNAEKKQDKKKGSLNKINIEPEMETGKPNA